jgi:hypothetical protein
MEGDTEAAEREMKVYETLKTQTAEETKLAHINKTKVDRFNEVHSDTLSPEEKQEWTALIAQNAEYLQALRRYHALQIDMIKAPAGGQLLPSHPLSDLPGWTDAEQ